MFANSPSEWPSPVKSNLKTAMPCRDSAAEIARELYMAGRVSRINRFLFTGSITEANVAEQYLEFAAENDLAVLQRFRARRANFDEQQVQLVAATARQASAVASLDRLGDTLLTRLAEADAAYSAIVAAYEEQEYQKWLATSTTNRAIPS